MTARLLAHFTREARRLGRWLDSDGITDVRDYLDALAELVRVRDAVRYLERRAAR